MTTTITVAITIRHGSEEYRIPKLLTRINNDPDVVDVQEVER